jgi:hypothetical protein
MNISYTHIKVGLVNHYMHFNVTFLKHNCRRNVLLKTVRHHAVQPRTQKSTKNRNVECKLSAVRKAPFSFFTLTQCHVILLQSSGIGELSYRMEWVVGVWGWGGGAEPRECILSHAE